MADLSTHSKAINLLKSNDITQFAQFISQFPPNHKLYDGNTFLHLAARHCKIQHVKCILSSNANIMINIKNDNDHNPLMTMIYALRFNRQLIQNPQYYQIIKHLIKYKANCNQVDMFGNNALILLCNVMHDDIDKAKAIIELLLDSGIECDLADRAILAANSHGNHELAAYINDY
jgi:hypothetical protein